METSVLTLRLTLRQEEFITQRHFRMINTPATGAPITAAATDAIPHIARPGPAIEKPRKFRKRPANAPAVTPMNIAGENIPPNSPNPIQRAVINNFRISNISK